MSGISKGTAIIWGGIAFAALSALIGLMISGAL